MDVFVVYSTPITVALFALIIIGMVMCLMASEARWYWQTRLSIGGAVMAGGALVAMLVLMDHVRQDWYQQFMTECIDDKRGVYECEALWGQTARTKKRRLEVIRMDEPSTKEKN